MDLELPTRTTTKTKELSETGFKLQRVFTTQGVHPFDTIEWTIKDAVIRGSGGKEKFRQDGVEVPASWGDNTVGIVVEKYFRVVCGVKETSAKQMFSRVALWIMEQGLAQGTLSIENSVIFFDELLYLLVHGMYAFNSPVWFNAGVVDLNNPDKKPQCSACFIQSVDDSMESIMNLQHSEVMLFKGGSGTGSNLSNIRSSWETLSGGGYASGPVSFMKGYDAFAGVTKSGGTTRRAAKMVCLNADHPDIIEQMNGLPGFINCKSDAEQQAQALYSTGKYSAEFNVAGNVYDRTLFQNANHSIRVTDEFMNAVVEDKIWHTKLKTGEVHRHYSAKKLFDAVAEAAWVCGDPGIQFDTATNNMHTCPNSGRINASNPCSEYLFLDDTACNLGSLNLLKFLDTNGNFDIKKFEAAVILTITAKEIIVDGSSYPTKKIAENSSKYRTLGLGFTNLGALLTFWGLPYDSEKGRFVAGAISSIMGGTAYGQSSILAKLKGPFSEYEINKEAMLSVIKKHRDIAHNSFWPSAVNDEFVFLIGAAKSAWDFAYQHGLVYGFRNAQTTVIAPTGTISFLMDCDTTGIEPMLGVITYKKAVGEGFLVIPNNIIKPALARLGYKDAVLEGILQHIVEKHNIQTAPGFNTKHSAIFAEALGEWAIRPEAHVDMMAAVQPFISGGISKTVNMPNKATKEDIGYIYLRAWQKGLKCIAIYRDSCKMSQPISTKIEEAQKEPQVLWGTKKKLPNTRSSKTHTFRVGDVKGILTVGNYPDGTLGEILLRVSKQGSFISGTLDSFAIGFSVALQYGASLEDLIEKYKGIRFDPAGFTGNPEIPIAHSIVDYIVRWLEIEYVRPLSATVSEQPQRELSKGPIQVIDLSGNPCRTCGGLTKRTGSCYTCTSCGDTTGCG